MQNELFDCKGNRKYLDQDELRKFEFAAKESGRETRTFCLMLLHSGCRISEVLELPVKGIDFSSKAVIVRSLKKRSIKKIYRSIPLPDYFLDELNLVHNLKDEKDKNKRIWEWSRAKASRKVGQVMNEAKIKGVQACPKGLRHGFVITCLEKKIPLNMAQKWAGHSSLSVTAIYANALGKEERNIAARLWE